MAIAALSTVARDLIAASAASADANRRYSNATCAGFFFGETHDITAARDALAAAKDREESVWARLRAACDMHSLGLI